MTINPAFCGNTFLPSPRGAGAAEAPRHRPPRARVQFIVLGVPSVFEHIQHPNLLVYHSNINNIVPLSNGNIIRRGTKQVVGYGNRLLTGKVGI